MPDENLKPKPLGAAAQARADVLALLRPRVDAVYANPVRGPDDLPMVSGDQMPITVPHAEFGLLYRLAPFQSKFGRSEALREKVRVVDFQHGEDWAALRKHRSDLSCLACISQDYPGALLNDVCLALEGAQD